MCLSNEVSAILVGVLPPEMVSWCLLIRGARVVSRRFLSEFGWPWLGLPLLPQAFFLGTTRLGPLVASAIARGFHPLRMDCPLFGVSVIW